tara:strand:- start:947 stop:1891 length:945 start_codon:yes stop_codon:yes gene_type:complete
MYPKEITDLLDSNGLGWKPSHNLNAHCGDYIEPLQRERWLLANQDAHKAIRDYFEFLVTCQKRFTEVAKSMGYWNKETRHSLGHDKWSVGWGGDALLPIAHYAYCLKSYGLSGNILECGAFKGSSTACLSIACELIGSTLFCADSFEGLPEGEAHYNKGDFVGTLDEVKKNVARNGVIESTRFIQGWYNESLKGFSEPISVLWIDVDLCSSTLDVLNNAYSAIEPNGIIFSDGFQAEVDYEGTRVKQIGHENAGLCEPAGIYQFFEGKKLDYQAIPAGPPGLALIVQELDESTPLRHQSEQIPTLLKALTTKIN